MMTPTSWARNDRTHPLLHACFAGTPRRTRDHVSTYQVTTAGRKNERTKRCLGSHNQWQSFMKPFVYFPRSPESQKPVQSTRSCMSVTVSAKHEPFQLPQEHITVHPAGMHYNSRYWDDPQEFKPRYLGGWPRGAFFIPFSGGARSFFETEGIAILTMLVSKYKIEIPEAPQFAGETFEEKKARIFRCTRAITLT
ncbi:cytochrome p450 [Moniliophthora roreri MCA 2997]|uniref:Cytochrome p450 n=1 Tax=Moniliophthora roreri (strain MCA 2997) TaxID=1381753 RepID=V2YIN5_MONRO|nr:cytochrome p450 [Moniliophthora roreri MCA 2997]